MSTLPEDAWVNSFLEAPPRPLLTALQKRLAGSNAHITALAELYKQRAAIEQAYADGLAKLARTAEQGGLHGKQKGEWDKNGGEARLWQVALQDLSETSASHSTLANLLRSDFEQPIRDLPSKIVPWRRITEQDSSLDKTLKDYEKVAGKLEKAKSKKADSLQAELDQLTSSLSSLSPMVYTTYQRLDEQRLQTLKEIIVRWGTVKSDIAARNGERADQTVASLLGWEPSEEVLAVGQRLGGGRSGSVAPSLGRASSATPSRTSDFSPRPSKAAAPPSSFGGGFKGMLGRSKTISRKRSNSNATSVQSQAADGFESLPEERSGDPPSVDEEGFSVPPPDRHRSLWDEPDDDIPVSALKTATLQPDMPNDSSKKIDMSIKSAPIEESEEQRQAALAKVQQKLTMPAPPSRRATVGRGRRDVRNTMFPGSLPSDGGSPFESPSLAAPEISVAQGRGLRANVTEAVNVILRAGQVQRLQVNGEIHLGTRSGGGAVHLRINRFENLEKIAPNPQYLSQVPDAPGEYQLDTDQLASAPSHPKGTLLFKYQVHTESDLILPLMLEPAFLCKEGETRMILNYRAARPLSITLVASFEGGAGVSNVQAKPAGGTWSSSTRKMTWDCPVEGEGKIIAKFTTDGVLKPTNVQASWAIEGDLISGISLEGGEIDLVQGITSGKYVAEPTIS